MKKAIKMMLIFMGIVLVVFIAGCNQSLDEPLEAQSESLKEEALLPQEFSEHGLLAYPRGVIRIDDFKATGKMRSGQDVERLVEAKKLGESPDNAIVMLTFHPNGVLYTPHEVNSSDGNLRLDDAWFVDLKTFQKVTGLKEATAEYSRSFGLFWVFDPMVRFYETRAQKEQWGNASGTSSTRAVSSSPLYLQYFKTGNILYGEWQRWSPAGYTGHTAGIVSVSDFGPACYTGDDALKKTIVVEGMPVAGIVEHRPIYSSSSFSDWRSSNMNRRCIIYMKKAPTDQQRQQLREFQENQVGKKWRFPLLASSARQTKEDSESFYCSKLQWWAYKTVMGVDLDSDGGDWVFPRDILYDDDVSYIDF